MADFGDSAYDGLDYDDDHDDPEDLLLEDRRRALPLNLDMLADQYATHKLMGNENPASRAYFLASATEWLRLALEAGATAADIDKALNANITMVDGRLKGIRNG